MNAHRLTAVLRTSVSKELRDIGWLALSIALGACLAVFGVDLAFDAVVPLFARAERSVLWSVALLCTLPIAAEALCVDSRTGLASWQRGTPATTTRVLTAKAVALVLCWSSFALVLAGTTLVLHRPDRNWSLQSQTDLMHWLTVSAPIALGTVMLTAAVTKHSLVALLAGLGVSSLCAALIVGTAHDRNPSLALAHVFQFWNGVAPALGGGGLALACVCVLPALGLRGRATRSAIRRGASVASGLTAILILGAWRELPAVTAATELGFDDESARVARLLPSPDGRRLALEFGFMRRPGARSWWLVELDGERAPTRLSTHSVVDKTAIGAGQYAELLDWALDGEALLGWSSVSRSVSREHDSQTTWSLSPESLDVQDLTPAEYAEAIGDWSHRRTARTEEGGVGHEVWSFRDGTYPLVVECAQRLTTCQQAPGVGYFLDPAREVHRVDLLAGSSRGLGVHLAARERPPQFSQDGRWMIRSRDARPRRVHTLIDVASGASTEFEGEYRWGRYDAPVLVPLDGDGLGPKVGYWASGQTWRVVTTAGTREVDFGFVARDLYPLADGRWIATSDERRRVTLHDTDGTLLRTLRKSTEEHAR